MTARVLVLYQYYPLLRHIILNSKLEVISRLPRNVRLERDAQRDRTSFLGLCDGFRRFTPSWARVADPLNISFRKNQPQPFDDLAEEKKTAMNAKRETNISTYALATSRQRAIHCQHRCLRQTSRCHIISRTARWTAETNVILLKIAHTSRKLVQYDRGQMPRRLMGTLSLASLSGRKSIYHLYQPLCPSTDSKPCPCDQDIRTMASMTTRIRRRRRSTT